MTPPNDDKLLDEYLRGDSALSRAYRGKTGDAPPARLDAAILAQAREAASASTPRGWNPFSANWTVPLSAAAVVVVSVVLVLFMSREGPLPPVTEMESTPVTAVPATPPAREQTSLPEAATSPMVEPMKKVAPAPAPAQLLEQRTTRPSETTTFARSTSRTARDEANVQFAATAVRALANVVSVNTSGNNGAYRFAVQIRSGDTGCRQYADWWEVLSEDGRLIYRHLLAHSHVKEQPFTLEGGPVAVAADTTIWIRAHMNPDGYGGVALKGSVRDGFKTSPMPPAFASKLAQQPPQPGACEF